MNAWPLPLVSKVLSLRWKESDLPLFIGRSLFFCVCVAPFSCQRPLGVSAYFDNYFNSVKNFFFYSLQTCALGRDLVLGCLTGRITAKRLPYANSNRLWQWTLKRFRSPAWIDRRTGSRAGFQRSAQKLLATRLESTECIGSQVWSSAEKAGAGGVF